MTKRERLLPDIRHMRDVEHKTWREIAEALGVGLKVANQWYHDPTGEKVAARKAKNDGRCLDCGGVTRSGGCRIPPQRCRGCHDAYASTLPGRRALGAHVNLKWTDAQILEAIRAAAQDGSCTSQRYQDFYEQAPKGTLPSLPIICRRFGLWSIARGAAGATGYRPGGEYSTRLTEEGALLAVEECARSLGCLPTYSQYARWASDTDAPSGSLVRMRCKTWMRAVELTANRLPELVSTP